MTDAEASIRAALEDAQARVERLFVEIGKWAEMCEGLRDERDAALTRASEAEADARRYRWLRDRYLGADFEWGGSSNYFRGTADGNKHLPAFELWTMGYPDAWRQLMPPATRSSRKSPRRSSKQR